MENQNNQLLLHQLLNRSHLQTTENLADNQNSQAGMQQNTITTPTTVDHKLEVVGIKKIFVLNLLIYFTYTFNVLFDHCDPPQP